MSSQKILTQLPVGQIGFGAMRITGPGIWGPPRDEGEAIALLRRAVEKGVTFIDTADSYGPGVSGNSDRQGAPSLSRRAGGGHEGRARAPRGRPLGHRLSTRAFAACLCGQPATA